MLGAKKAAGEAFMSKDEEIMSKDNTVFINMSAWAWLLGCLNVKDEYVGQLIVWQCVHVKRK